MVHRLSDTLSKLKKILSEMDSVLIAYSGGTGSTFLAKIASEKLGKKAFTVTIDSKIHPRSEMEEARKTIQQLGINNIIIRGSELQNDTFLSNPKERCYLCKKEIFSKLKRMAEKKSINFIADGSNCDDLNENRPGLMALCELKIRSLYKKQVFLK